MVNGLAVYQDFDRHDIEIRRAIGHLLKEGENTFGLKLFYDFEKNHIEHKSKDSSAEAVIQIKQEDGSFKDIAQVKIAGTTTEEDVKALEKSIKQDWVKIPIGSVAPQTVEIQEGYSLNLRRQFNIEIPYPDWAWVNSEKIPNTKETLKNVIDYYQGLTRLLDSKNESKITEIFLEKSSEMGKALGYSTEVMFEEIEILGVALKANNDNSGWVRKDPEWEKAELEFAMDAKLVRLVAPPYGPAIYYENDDLYNSFEIWLRKDGDKFVISR